MLPLVWSCNIVASTDRGAEFGKRWLDRVLSGGIDTTFCAGADLIYFRNKGAAAEKVHRRNVSTTRGTSITRKRIGACSVIWTVTFTMNAADPFEYGQSEPWIAVLGGTVTGTGKIAQGTVALTQQACPVYDYSPIYDPAFPALVASPTAPDLLPDNWGIFDGMTFDRRWCTINAHEPNSLLVVPIIKLSTTVAAQMIRVSIFPSSAANTAQCGALFSVVVGYLPANQNFYIDGEQKAAYTWDGASAVRRADSLIYSPTGGPVDWTAFNDPTSMMIVLDVFADSDGYEGDGNVRASLDFMAKSD
jgi:hypothetical protein